MAALINTKSAELVKRAIMAAPDKINPEIKTSFELLNQLTTRAANQEKNWNKRSAKLSEETQANLQMVALWQQIIANKHNYYQQSVLLHQLALLLNIEKKLKDPSLHLKLKIYAEANTDRSSPSDEAYNPLFPPNSKFSDKNDLLDVIPLIDENLNVVKQALSEVGLLVPPYNQRLKKIYAMVNDVMTVYQLPSVSNTTKQQASTLLACLNNLIYNTDTARAYEDACKILAGQKITEPALVKAFTQLKRYRQDEKIFYHRAYGSVYRTFLETMKPDKGSENWQWLKDNKNNYPIDKKTETLLTSIFEKFGKGYIESAFTECFTSSENTSEPDYKNLLNTFLQKLKTDFIDTQRFDMTNKGLSESRKQMLLNEWKHYINRFARKHGLPGGIVHRDQLDVDLEVCQDLLKKLNHYTRNIQSSIEKENPFAQHATEFKIRIGKFTPLKQQLEDLEKKANKHDKNIVIVANLITDLNNLKYGPHSLSLGTLLEEAINNFIANDSLENRNHFLKILKKCKKRLGQHTKKLRSDLIDTLDETLFPYTLHERKYEWQDEGHTTHFRKKQERKLKKWISRPIAEGSTLVLTFGQACMSLYAGLFFFPLIGPAAFILSGLFFIFTLVTNYILLRASTIAVLKQLIVKRDFFVGFKNTGGKLLIGLSWVTAIFFGLTLAFLTLLSTQAAVLAVALIFPPLAPIAEMLALSVAGIIGITTAVGFTALYFVSIAGVITNVCDWLEKKCPLISEYGWGFKGLVKGLWHSLKPNRSFVELLRSASHSIGHFIYQQYRYYWSDPTGNPNDDRQKIWRARISHILGSAFKWTFVVGAIGLTAVGIYAELVSWNAEIANFLTRSGANQLISSLIAGALVYTFTAAAEYIFTFRSYTRFFVFVAEVATSIVDKALIHPTTLLFNSPKRFWKEIVIGYPKVVINAVDNYCQRLVDDPVKTLKETAIFALKGLLAVLVGGNAVAQGAFVLKGAVTPAHVDIHNVFKPETAAELTPFADVSRMTYVNAFAYAGSSAACNANETQDYINTFIPAVPLVAARDEEAAHLANQQELAKIERKKELDAPSYWGGDDYSPSMPLASNGG